jgi:hypothetical protein
MGESFRVGRRFKAMSGCQYGLAKTIEIFNDAGFNGEWRLRSDVFSILLQLGPSYVLNAPLSQLSTLNYPLSILYYRPLTKGG